MPYLTPDTIPVEAICRRLRIPNDLYILGAVTGALQELCQARNWEKHGDIEPEEMASAMRTMLLDFEGNNACMIGMIFPFIRTTLPDNWLLCDGSGYLRVDYPELYEAFDGLALQTGADTFVTPDLGGHFLLPANGAYPVFSSGGEAAHILTVGELASHDHVQTHQNGTINAGTGASTSVVRPTGNSNTNTRGNGTAHNNMPPYIALPYAIVAR